MLVTLLTLFFQSGRSEGASAQQLVARYIRELGENPTYQYGDDEKWKASDYLMSSTDPRAVQYVLRQFRRGNENFSRAYFCLATTGGKEGVEAVRAAKIRKAVLKPIESRVLDDLNRKWRGEVDPFVEAKDSSGRTWGIARSRVLGDRGDLWLLRKKDGKWADPVYTGVTITIPGRMHTYGWQEPSDEEKKNAKDLLQRTPEELDKWRAQLTKDTDHDGLTDLVETRRLSTKPDQADSDRDGKPDGIDAWPNVTERPLSDDEALLATIFEAIFHDDDDKTSYVFWAPPGAQPFEMPGRRGPTIWANPKDEKGVHYPLFDFYELGTGFVRFYENTGPLPNRSETPLGRLIGWDSKKGEARVEFGIHWGRRAGSGYVATVRKFGPDWLVTSQRLVAKN